MKIKGMDGTEHSVTGYGQGVYNTIGASLGIASFLGMGANSGCGNNGGILGGLFGGNCGCGGNQCVNVREQNLALALSQAQSREYSLATAREEDSKIFAESRRVDDKLAAVLAKTNEGLLQIGNAVSRNDVRLACLEEKVQWIREESARNLREAKEYADHLVACEAKERQAADQNILAYTNAELAKKISGELVISGDQIRYGGCKPVLCNTSCQGTESNPLIVKQAAEQAAQAVMAALKK